MSEFNQLRGEVIALTDEALDVLRERLGARESRALANARERLVDERFFVLVCGEFKRGKSSLINALLNEPELCPTDVDIATSLVTTIGYADRETFTVHVGGIGQAKPQEISRSEVAGYVTESGNPGNRKQARLVEVGLPNERLRSGLLLVDTPGVGGVNVEHTAVTYSFLPNADAVLFVCDAIEPLSTKELDFLADAAGHCDTVLVAVTKIDLAPDADAVVASTRERVVERLARVSGEVLVIPISNSRKLDGETEDDPELVEASNFPALEHELWEGIGRDAGALQLTAALRALEASIERVRAPLAVECTAIREESEEKLNELRQRLVDLRERNDEFKRNRAAWRSALSDGLDSARRESIDSLDDELDLVDRKLETEYLTDLGLLEVPEELVRNVVRDLSLALAEAGKRFGEQTQDLLDELAGTTALDLGDLPGVEPPTFEGTVELPGLAPIEPNRRSPTRKLLKAGRGALFNTRPAGIIGGIIGGALAGIFSGGLGAPAGAAVGYAIGSLIGGTSGLREQVEVMKGEELRDRRNAVISALNPIMKKNKRDARRALTSMADTAKKQLTAALTERIDAEGGAIEEMQHSVDNAGRMTAEQARTRHRELEEHIRQLDGLSRRAHTIRAAVLAQADGTAPAAGLVELDGV